jgi:hypothetical protein
VLFRSGGFDGEHLGFGSEDGIRWVKKKVRVAQIGHAFLTMKGRLKRLYSIFVSWCYVLLWAFEDSEE